VGRTKSVVVVGGGIVGCAVAEELTRHPSLGVTLVDKGALPCAGGSSSHAPGLVFQTNPSRALSQFAQYSVQRYRQLSHGGVDAFSPVGSLEVATTPDRLADIHRRHGFATAWGIPSRVIDSDEVVRRFPIIDGSAVLAGLYVPSDGLAHPTVAIAALLEVLASRDVAVLGSTEVTGVDLRDGRLRGVSTTAGDIEADAMILCAGMWGPVVARMAGIDLPLQPMAHQYATTSPLAALAGLLGARPEVPVPSFPILRHQERALYFRTYGDRVGIGSYSHPPQPVDPGAIDELSRDSRMPSVLPCTEDDFAASFDDAVALLPALSEAKVQDVMNGLFSFTADGFPLVGEAEAVRGFFVAEAVWITHAFGVARAAAAMVRGEAPGVDLHECDLGRWERPLRDRAYLMPRAIRSFVEVYDIIHPLQPIVEPRGLRTSPFVSRELALGAQMTEANGWERPQWYEANAGELTRWPVPSRQGWSARFWSPIVGAEHLAARQRVALFDMTPLRRLEVSGPGALSFLEQVTTGRLDRASGSVVYALMLDDGAHVLSDVTIARLGASRFQVGTNSPTDEAWMVRHLPDDASVTVRDITGGTCCVGLWGPAAKTLLARLTSADLDDGTLRYFRCREINVGEVPVTAMRLSYGGEAGYELYTSADYGLHLWDLLHGAGEDLGILAAGRGAFEGMRIEKGYRSYGRDVTAEHHPDEVGLSFAVHLGDHDFIGRSALEQRTAASIENVLCCCTLDDGTAVVMGKEPVYSDGNPAGYVTSAAYGYTVGRTIAYAFLPVALAAPGAAVEIEYFGERLPAHVVSEPCFDPQGSRVRG
jgi:dimethylglycine oxidase